MAQKYPCPSCGGEIVFQTTIAPYAVCPYCKTMVVQKNDALENIGTMASLPADLSPFEIGTEGYCQGHHFGIVGRMKLEWSDGVWNEWFFVSDDGRKGWLAEAQGFYAPCFEVTEGFNPENSPALKQMDGIFGSKKTSFKAYKELINKRIYIKGRNYTVVDVKSAECIGAEGELPLSTPVGRESICIDMLDEDGVFASLDICDGEVRAYVGQYVDWKTLRPSRFRLFEGW